MDPVITEKKYPIQGLWVLKQVLYFGLLFGAMFPLVLLDAKLHHDLDSPGFLPFMISGVVSMVLFLCLVQILRRRTFHYSIDDKFLNLRQGVLSRQQRLIPYGVIQNILVRQGLSDRLFGLATLIIENASQGAGSLKVFGLTVKNKENRRLERIGFYGNAVRIPGLTKQNAETLKAIILQKMEENPIDDSRSGL